MQIKHSSILGLFFIFAISVTIPGKSKLMAEARMISHSSSSSPGSDSGADVYIVYTEKPAATAAPESYHLSTLASVLGSEEAAKQSLVYVYKNAATGFAAKLTPEQVSQLEKQPGVLQVVRNENLQLLSGAGTMKKRIGPMKMRN